MLSYIIAGAVMCDLWTQHRHIKISENEKELISLELADRLVQFYKMKGL